MVISNQSDIQICLGLRNILCGLIFLAEQAGVRHLNISTSSIYVTDEGTWKLAGFEHLWRVKEVNPSLLDQTRNFRYQKSIEVNETKNNGVGLEQFAFGVLTEEIFKIKKQDWPTSLEFKNYAASHLKNSNILMRPKLSAILLHPYFNHEFITIHSFLAELPLKTQQEKQSFFAGIVERLKNFDETVIATQLGDFILSRIVLLDLTAQMCLLPYILKPRTEDIIPGIFSVEVFIKFIIPKIKQVFCVRDSQIRLILLEYFTDYIDYCTEEDLKEIILPQLLLGIKDTNDVLVATTLRCLADLVPILGSSTVIGGNRSRLFADGRPQGHPETSTHWTEARSITPVINSGELISHSPIPDNVDISESYASVDLNLNNGKIMPERLSPDGGEDFKTVSDVEIEEIWSDWENDDRSLIEEKVTENFISNNKLPIQDINELDIKNQKSVKIKDEDEIDFFKDMEPVIQKSSVLILKDSENDEKSKVEVIVEKLEEIEIDKSRFDIKISSEVDEDGWGEEEEDTNEWDNV